MIQEGKRIFNSDLQRPKKADYVDIRMHGVKNATTNRPAHLEIKPASIVPCGEKNVVSTERIIKSHARTMSLKNVSKEQSKGVTIDDLF